MDQGIARRGLPRPLVQRLGVALAAGAMCLAVVFGFVAADRRDDGERAARAARERTLAQSLADRGAALLARNDVLRLSMLAAVVRDEAAGRALVLDGDGTVVLDTALALGDKRLGLLSQQGPLQRRVTPDGESPLRETVAPIQHAGTTIGEVRLQCAEPGARGGFDLGAFGMALLVGLSLTVAAMALVRRWAARLRMTTDALLRLAAGDPAAARLPAGGEREFRELHAAVGGVERALQDGLARVDDGYAALALQVVDGLERRRLAVAGHGERTAQLAASLADRLGLADADAADLDLACRLIDLGKASIRPSVLQKAEPLTALEAESLRLHPVRAAERLEGAPGLRDVAATLRHQLERWDGKGSPDGLRGERIPLGSRVLAVAAAFDLLTSCAEERPLQWHEALERLAAERGAAFDPQLVDLLVDVVEQAPPDASDREILVVQGGALPWRADAARATVLASVLGATAADDHDEHGHDADCELELVADGDEKA